MTGKKETHKSRIEKTRKDFNRVVFLLFPATFFMLIFLTYPFVLIVYLINLISGYYFIKKKLWSDKK